MPTTFAELVGHGTCCALARLSKEFISCSSIFKAFATQIYTHSITNNLIPRHAHAADASLCQVLVLDAVHDLLLGVHSCAPYRPFLFNPHQFSFADFIVDYRTTNPWIGYCRFKLPRTMITGKKKKLGRSSEELSGDALKFSFPALSLAILLIAYVFVKSFSVLGQNPPSPLIRIAVVSLGPIVWNSAILLVLLLLSLFP